MLVHSLLLTHITTTLTDAHSTHTHTHTHTHTQERGEEKYKTNKNNSNKTRPNYFRLKVICSAQMGFRFCFALFLSGRVQSCACPKVTSHGAGWPCPGTFTLPVSQENHLVCGCITRRVTRQRHPPCPRHKTIQPPPVLPASIDKLPRNAGS